MKTIIDLFNVGMMRNFSDIVEMPSGVVLNIGAGKKLIDGSIPLDFPEWNAEFMAIPYEDNSVDGIHCYHFLEHIQDVPFVMSEMRRVLKPGAPLNIVVPYYTSAMQHQDLDHKHSFTEKTFSHLFNSDYYEKGKVEPMHIRANFLMGESGANLALVVQLIKPMA